MQHQNQMMELEELKKMEEKLWEREEERDKAVEELKEMKRVHEVNSKPSVANKIVDLEEELNFMKESLSKANQELNMKEKNTDYLKLELEKAKNSEFNLAVQNASLNRLQEELSRVKCSEFEMGGLLSKTKSRIQDLEVELGKRKESDRKMYSSLVMQTNQLEQTKILLEESKLEISSLQQKLERMEGSSTQHSMNNSYIKEELQNLKSELQLTKENLGQAQDAEKDATLKLKAMSDGVTVLKLELKCATEAEENGKKALDDLALALKEVATEASQVKEKLYVTQTELEQAKTMLKSNEQKYKVLLNEAWKESERHQNTAHRLKTEAEESLLAWNGKETGFVNCIKIAEEEKIAAQEDNAKLIQLIKETENMHKTAREEISKLRDILKQALNEANVAKEAASIARAENSELKDSIAEKDVALDFLTKEYEHIKASEAAAMENINEFKRLLAETQTNGLKPIEEKEVSKLKTETSIEKKHNKETNILTKVLSFNQKEKEVKVAKKCETEDENEEEDDEEADPLRGSIFDVDSPLAQRHQRNKSSAFGGDEDIIKSEDFDHLDDMDSDRNGGKKKALLRRFGDLIIRRKSFHRREISE